MLGRVFHVQVLEAKDYQSLSNSQSIRRDILSPRRGEILDRRFNRLAVNADMRQDKEGQGRAWNLSRLCPNGALAGQVLGNVGRDGFGQGGLEFSFDKELRGSDGWRYARHDVKNRYYPEFDPRAEHAVDGRDVILTLDVRMQAIAEQALERGILRVGAKRGTAILVDPKTGDILALANYPFYNPNSRERSLSEAWKDLAVTMVYEPGSTFKLITASALLEENAIAPGDTLDGEDGKWQLAGQTIRDTHPRGRISFSDAMAYSSNICFAKAGGLIAAPTFYRYLRSFGFGMKTGIELPAEEGGLLKPVAEWSGRTQQTIAFGHELSVTPLQLIMAASAIANDGVLMKPRIVKAFREGRSQDAEENPSRKVRRVVSSETALKVMKMLRGVVDYGTATEIKRQDFPMAGKTGTAEKIDPVTGKYLQGTFHSSFLGMAPADSPALVGLVMVDEPSQFKYGGQCAAPIWREIVDRLIVLPDPVVALSTEKAEPAGEVVLAEAGADLEMGEYRPVALKDAGEELPDVRGTSAEKARSLLSPMGLPVKFHGIGTLVLAQFPAPGKTLLPGDTLNLTLGEIHPGSMPDVEHCTLRDALLRLRSLGLEVDYRGNGRVLKQEPPAGAAIQPGQTCILQLGWMG